MIKSINLKVIDTKTIGFNPYQLKDVMDIIEARGVETFKKEQLLKGNTLKELAIEYIEMCIHTYVRNLIWNLDIGSEEFIEKEIINEMKDVYAKFIKEIA